MKKEVAKLIDELTESKQVKEDSIDDDLFWKVLMKAWESDDETDQPDISADVVKGLIHLQSDLLMQLLQVRQHHWHVQGMIFRDVHLFFDEATDELLEMIDDTSERIVAAGGIAPTNPKTFMAISDIPLIDEDVRDANLMLQQFDDGIAEMLDDIADLNDLASDDRQIGIMNMIGDTAQNLEKLQYKCQQFLSTF